MIRFIFVFFVLVSHSAFAQLSNSTVDVNVLGGTLSLTGTSAVTQSGPWAVSVSNFPPTQNVNVTNGSIAVTGPLTDTQLRASAVPVSLASVPTHPVIQSGVWSVGADTELTAPAALADATSNPTISNIASYLLGFNGTTWDRLRSSTSNGLVVDVSRVQGNVAVTGPLTDAQLRATAVPISGTITANAGTGTFQTNITNASIAVTGPLTDTQLRATAVPVSGSVTATISGTPNVSVTLSTLPTGASTSALQTTGNTSLGNIDTKTPALVSGRVPVDGSGVTQPVSGTVTANQSGVWSTRGQDGAGNPLASYDLDNSGGTSFNLGVSLRTLSNGTPVETGVPSNPLQVNQVSVQRTPGFLVTTTTGTVTAGAKSVSFYNSGSGNATVVGSTLAPFETLDFEAPMADTLGAMAYDATGTTLKIAEVR